MQVRQPVRVRHRYRQQLDGTPEEVFPLLCPVRECEWVAGWRPGIVITTSGVVERDCIFTTADGALPEGASAGGEREATWVVLEHDPATCDVEMIKVSPGHLVTRLRIVVAPDDRPGRSVADVTYEYTAIGESGEEYVRGRTPDAWRAFMEGWETALNQYLARARLAAV